MGNISANQLVNSGYVSAKGQAGSQNVLVTRLKRLSHYVRRYALMRVSKLHSV
jgi:hypothetical protein